MVTITDYKYIYEFLLGKQFILKNYFLTRKEERKPQYNSISSKRIYKSCKEAFLISNFVNEIVWVHEIER